jgi:thiamine-monophosphate kinase
LAQQLGLALTRIGRIEAEPGLRLVDTAGEEHAVAAKGHDHFR